MAPAEEFAFQVRTVRLEGVLQPCATISGPRGAPAAAPALGVFWMITIDGAKQLGANAAAWKHSPLA